MCKPKLGSLFGAKKGMNSKGRSRLLVVVVVVSLSLWACALPTIPSSDPTQYTYFASGSPVPYTNVYQGVAAYPTAKQKCVIVMDGEELMNKWVSLHLQGDPPIVDFSKQQTLVIYEGYSSNPTSLDILGITKSEDIITVNYSLYIQPLDEEGIPKALIVSLPVSDASVEIMRHEWHLGTHTAQIVECE
jgi:hypothetical protein